MSNKKTLYIIIAVLVLIVIGVGGFFLYQRVGLMFGFPGANQSAGNSAKQEGKAVESQPSQQQLPSQGQDVPASSQQVQKPALSSQSEGLFSNYVVLGAGDSSARGGEPTVQVAKSGNIWISENGQTHLWKSVDNGNTWTFIKGPLSIGGADADAAEDGKGRLHVVDQTNGGGDCIFYYRSSDGGKTFDKIKGTHGNGIWFDGQGDCKIGVGGGGIGVDKPWIRTFGDNGVFIAYKEGGGGTGVDYSNDGGETFTHTHVNAGDVNGIALDSLDGSLYLFYNLGTGFDAKEGASFASKAGVSYSLDNGKSFSNNILFDSPGTNSLTGGFISGAVDKSHNVYVVWSNNVDGEYRIYMSFSKDHGKSWSAPLKISSGDGVNIMPSITAGDEGKIAIAWYGTPTIGKNRYSVANSEWFVYVAISMNALGEKPSFLQSKVSEEPFHHNSICAHVNICENVDVTTGKLPPGYEGGIADFFSITHDNDGFLDVVWADTAHYKDDVKDHFAKQVAGDKIFSK